MKLMNLLEGGRTPLVVLILWVWIISTLHYTFWGRGLIFIVGAVTLELILPYEAHFSSWIRYNYFIQGFVMIFALVLFTWSLVQLQSIQWAKPPAFIVGVKAILYLLTHRPASLSRKVKQPLSETDGSLELFPNSRK